MAKKRFYWLKLREDFFTQKEVKKLRKIAGGDTYTIIYLKLLLRSLRSGGKLYYEGVEENFASEMALDIDEDPENVEVTVRFLLARGILQRNTEEEYEILTAAEMTGSEGDSTKRVRQYRERKALQCNANETGRNANVTERNENVTPDIEIELEKELEEKKKSSPDGDDQKEKPVAAAGGGSGKPGHDPDLGEVMTAYMDKINPTPSAISMGELADYYRQMGKDVCLRAMDIALDERQPKWSYIRGILRAKKEQGVKCLADWDALEEAREAQRTREAERGAPKPREEKQYTQVQDENGFWIDVEVSASG